MESNYYLEELLLNFNMKSGIDVIMADKNIITYFIGNTEKCIKYLHTNVSKELKEYMKNNNGLIFLTRENSLKIIENDDKTYQNQSIIILKEGNIAIIFLKEEDTFTDNDISLIKSTCYLIEKFFTK